LCLFFAAAMAPSIVGKYQMESSENFDEYMKGIGVGLVMRKMANAASPAVEITEADGTYSLKTSTTFKTTEISFKLGAEFEETTADGRTVKSTMTLDEKTNTLTHNQVGNKEKKEKDSCIIRKFTDSGFDMECKVDDIVAKRVYKRQ